MSFVPWSYGDQHYQFDRRPGLPVLILSNSLGTDFTMWESQADTLRDHVSLLRYDTRGQGSSSVPPGPYTIAQMGEDVLAMMNALEIETAHFCGLSMGGLVGQWLGIHASQRLRSLTLCNTAAKVGSPEAWNARIEAVQRDGIAPIVPAVLERWYSPAYRNQANSSVEVTRALLLRNDPVGYIGGCTAVRDADFRDVIHRIETPTMVIAGSLDPVTTVADANFLATEIPGSTVTLLEASHLSNIEAAASFNAALQQFCQSIEEGQ